MYSVVLMMALSGSSAEVPSYGCYGCSGGGEGCYGGCSGSCHGRRGHRSRHGCHGCHGGGHGCCGGSYGCSGGYGAYGCSGSYGGYGSYGGWYGNTYAPGEPMMMSPTGAQPYYYGQPSQTPERLRNPGTGGEASVPAPATILVRLPAGALLTVDDAPTISTSPSRVFVTPPLDRNQEYQYTLKAELVRNDRKVTSSKRVLVHAGKQTQVTFEFPETTVSRR